MFDEVLLATPYTACQAVSETVTFGVVAPTPPIKIVSRLAALFVNKKLSRAKPANSCPELEEVRLNTAE
jgi:hypothetical protein